MDSQCDSRRNCVDFPRVGESLMIDTDFSIHLFHDSKKMERSGSSLGLCLASALKEFGLVNHSIWIEMHSK